MMRDRDLLFLRGRPPTDTRSSLAFVLPREKRIGWNGWSLAKEVRQDMRRIQGNLTRQEQARRFRYEKSRKIALPLTHTALRELFDPALEKSS